MLRTVHSWKAFASAMNSRFHVFVSFFCIHEIWKADQLPCSRDKRPLTLQAKCQHRGNQDYFKQLLNCQAKRLNSEIFISKGHTVYLQCNILAEFFQPGCYLCQYSCQQQLTPPKYIVSPNIILSRLSLPLATEPQMTVSDLLGTAMLMFFRTVTVPLPWP